MPDGLLVRPVPAPVQARDRRGGRLGARGEHDAVGFEDRPVGKLHAVLACQARLLHEDLGARVLVGPGAVRRLLLDHAPDAGHDRGEVDLDGRDADAEVARAPGEGGHARGLEHGLCRVAAIVGAFAAQLVALGHRDAHAGAREGTGHVGTGPTPADDEDVDPFHSKPLRTMGFRNVPTARPPRTALLGARPDRGERRRAPGGAPAGHASGVGRRADPHVGAVAQGRVHAEDGHALASRGGDLVPRRARRRRRGAVKCGAARGRGGAGDRCRPTSS